MCESTPTLAAIPHDKVEQRSMTCLDWRKLEDNCRLIGKVAHSIIKHPQYVAVSKSTTFNRDRRVALGSKKDIGRKLDTWQRLQ